MDQITKLVAAVVLLACSALSFGPLTATRSGNTERPTVNVPVALRQANWLGSKGEGCCTFASLCTALNWCGHTKDAQYVRSHCGNGQSPESLAEAMAYAGLRFSWTVGDKDVAFLERSLAGRRAVMVAIDAREDSPECHMVDLVHLDGTSACLIDNNHPTELHWMSREAFLKEWFGTGSWAVCPIYTPAPPLAN